MQEKELVEIRDRQRDDAAARQAARFAMLKAAAEENPVLSKEQSQAISEAANMHLPEDSQAA